MSAQRIAVIGKLKPGSLERAEQIIEHGRLRTRTSWLESHSVFLASTRRVRFEGTGRQTTSAARRRPCISAGFGWGPFSTARLSSGKSDTTGPLAVSAAAWTPEECYPAPAEDYDCQPTNALVADLNQTSMSIRASCSGCDASCTNSPCRY